MKIMPGVKAVAITGLLGIGGVLHAGNGNIDGIWRWAWSEKAGWCNFRPVYGGATVTDAGVYGGVWHENVGWIRLAYDDEPPYGNTGSDNWGVNNDGNGNLSGYAWSEEAGWINFSPVNGGVRIDGQGNFSGYAWGENVGWIKFSGTASDGTAYGVKTYWPGKVPKPVVLAGGYWQVPGVSGGSLTMVGYVYDAEGMADIREVNIEYSGTPLGIEMSDDGTMGDFAAGDGLYGYYTKLPSVGGELKEILEIRAIDRSGNESEVWPYLTVTSDTVSHSLSSVSRKEDDSRSPMDINSLFPSSLRQSAARFPTATGVSRPEIKLAGYWDTEITTTAGGQLTMIALVTDADGPGDIASVEILYRGVGTGLFLEDDGRHADGTAGDGVYGFTAPVDPGIPAGRYLLELVARDHSGNESLPWPYLVLDGTSMRAIGQAFLPESSSILSPLMAISSAPTVMSTPSPTPSLTPGATSTPVISPHPARFPLFCPARIDYLLEDNPGFVETGDFNGDGVGDLVAAIPDRDVVAVLTGVGNGTFQPAVEYAVRSQPAAVAVDDFNGDGREDLAVANRGSGNVSILLGYGTGEFNGAKSYQVLPFPGSMDAGDFNGDGTPDLVTTSNTSLVAVLIGRGDGSFERVVDYPVARESRMIAVGEFNGDGLEDLAVLTAYHYGGNDVEILEGVGDGTFRGGVVYPTGENVLSLTTGEFNVDGNLDIALGNTFTGTRPGGVSIIPGNGDGTFGSIVRYRVEGNHYGVEEGDYDGDGDGDLATAGMKLRVFTGDGTGGFRHYSDYVAGKEPRSITAGNYDGDGKDDVAVANSESGGISVFLSGGGGGFEKAGVYGAGSEPRGVAVGDVNNDGIDDVVVANELSRDVTILVGDGQGSFIATGSYPAGNGPREIVIEDFNRDEKNDLAVGNNNSTYVIVLLGNGDGTFGAGAGYRVMGMPWAVASGDLNSDNVPDLVVGSSSGDVSVLLGDGSGAFNSAVRYVAGNEVHGVVVDDFNNDGDADVAAADYGNDAVTMLPGNGQGDLGPAASYPAGDGPVSVSSGDFDSDGNRDLVVANRESDGITVLAGDGTGGFQPLTVYYIGKDKSPQKVTASDVNGDGNDDILIMNGEANNVEILRGDGRGGFKPAEGYGAGRWPADMGLGDFNCDQARDLAVANNNDDTVSIFLNCRAASTPLSTTTPVPTWTPTVTPTGWDTPTITPTTTLTPTITPTAIPSPTPTMTPVITPTPVPREEPVIMVGGYGELPGMSGGPMSLQVYVYDDGGLGTIAEVALRYAGMPIGVTLADDGRNGDYGAGDGLYGIRVTMDPLPVPLRELLEVQARDRDGNESTAWPYLTVTAGGAPAPSPGEAPHNIRTIPTQEMQFILPEVTSSHASHGANRPEIPLAGYWDTAITTTDGGRLTIIALVTDADGLDDISSVEILYHGVGTGLFLEDDGQHADGNVRDGVYGFTVLVAPGVPAGRYLFELAAVDHAGNQSLLWPYLIIE